MTTEQLLVFLMLVLCVLEGLVFVEVRRFRKGAERK